MCTPATTPLHAHFRFLVLPQYVQCFRQPVEIVCSRT